MYICLVQKDTDPFNDAMNIASFSQLDRVTIEFDQNVKGKKDAAH